MYNLLEVLGHRGVENTSLDEGWTLRRCVFVYVCTREEYHRGYQRASVRHNNNNHHADRTGMLR